MVTKVTITWLMSSCKTGMSKLVEVYLCQHLRHYNGAIPATFLYQYRVQSHKISSALLYTPKRSKRRGPVLHAHCLRNATGETRHSMAYPTQRHQFLALQAWVFRGASQVWTARCLRAKKADGSSSRNAGLPATLSSTWLDLSNYDHYRTLRVGSSSTQYISEVWHRSQSGRRQKRNGWWIFPTTYSFTSANVTRRGSILAHMFLGRKYLDCEPTRKILTSRQYTKIQPCNIAKLQLHRMGDPTYSFVIPKVSATMH